jgi:hypothetical protein
VGAFRQLHRHRDIIYMVVTHHQLITFLPSLSRLCVCLRSACPSQWHRVDYRPSLSCLILCLVVWLLRAPLPCLVSLPCSRGSLRPLHLLPPQYSDRVVTAISRTEAFRRNANNTDWVSLLELVSALGKSGKKICIFKVMTLQEHYFPGLDEDIPD